MVVQNVPMQKLPEGYPKLSGVGGQGHFLAMSKRKTLPRGNVSYHFKQKYKFTKTKTYNYKIHHIERVY